jgi:hypothetical protein
MPKGYLKSDVPFQHKKPTARQKNFIISSKRKIKKENWYEPKTT